MYVQTNMAEKKREKLLIKKQRKEGNNATKAVTKKTKVWWNSEYKKKVLNVHSIMMKIGPKIIV